MNPDDLLAVQKTITTALANADSFNKVYIAGAAVVASLIAAALSAIVQLLIARGNRKSQEASLEHQLRMQELASRRIAAASIATKRQAWIDELRKDVSAYLGIWRGISRTWLYFEHNMGDDYDPETQSAELKALAQDTVMSIHQMRREALELLCRVQTRLNPEEEPHKKLNELLIGVERTVADAWDDNSTPTSVRGEMVQESIDKVIPALRVILKEEWEQVKRESYVDPHMALGSAASRK